jgi:branched-chain amino acid transport system ATP-binding protein
VSSESSLLSVADLSVSFNGLPALSNVSLDLYPNEVVGIIGPNGAGKTTLFNSISGLVKCSGSLQLSGALQPWPKPHQLADLGIARTLQGVGLFPEMTVAENVMVGATRFAKAGLIGAALNRITRDEKALRERAMIALEKVYAATLADEVVAGLPYPVTKRVAIARALVSEPKILMLDEPAGGLGAADIEWMNNLIHNLSLQTSILLVEHHMDVVMNVCDRIYVLNFGQIIASGAPEEVRNNPAVIEAYLGVQE